MMLFSIISIVAAVYIGWELFKAKKSLKKFSAIISLEEICQKIEKELDHKKETFEKEYQARKDAAEKEYQIRAEAFENEVNVKTSSIERDLQNKRETVEAIQKQSVTLETSIIKLKNERDTLEKEVQNLKAQDDLKECGFYNPRYKMLDLKSFETRLEAIKERQKTLISDKKAIRCDIKWTVGGSEKEGERMTNQNIKLGLSSYNGQVDNIILTVNYKNVDRSEDKISKIRNSIDKMMESNKCYVTEEYHKLKIEELYLVYEYEAKIQEEKEEQKRIKQQMQEEAREIRLLEKAKEEAEKEEKEFQKEISKLKKELEKGHSEEKIKLESMIADLESKLAEASSKKDRAISLASQTKMGHVYIISNIGSFGENIYKIGMTRRENPYERVDELGDASVPFDFDVHGMIFSENAPALENHLHKYFQDKTVNKINLRKEFFNINIDDIQMACSNFGLKIELTKLAEAKDFRLSKEKTDEAMKKAA